MNVLLAESSEAQRQVIAEGLAGLGYEQVTAVAGSGEAWERLQGGGVELLIADRDLENGGGLALIARLREDHELGSLPALVMSATPARDDVVAAVRAGVNGYLVKPFAPAQLREKIDKVVHRTAQNAERRAVELIGGSGRLEVADDYPFVLFAEKLGSPRELAKPHKREVLQSLCAGVDALTELNRRYPDLAVDYVIEANPYELIHHLRLFRRRLKVLMLAHEVDSTSMTLARMARINKADDFAVCVLVDRLADFPISRRQRLEQLGIALLERRQLNSEILEWYFREQIFARRHHLVDEELELEQIQVRLERDIELTPSLPVFPPVYGSVQELDSRSGHDLEGWIDLAESDPALSAMVLRRARAPFYSRGADVETVEQAVRLLGKELVRQLLLSGPVRDSFAESDGEGEARADEGAGSGFAIEDFWLHSVAAGRVAFLLDFPAQDRDWDACQLKAYNEMENREVVRAALARWDLHAKLEHGPGEDPFVGGMVHDLGKALLNSCYPGLWPALVANMDAAGWERPMATAEQQVIGLDHTRVGALIGRLWNLGDAVTRTIERHHDPDPDDGFVQLIALSDFIAGALYPYPADVPFPAARMLARSEGGCQLSPEDREVLAPFLPGELPERLGIDLAEIMDVTQLMAPGLRQYLNRVKTSLGSTLASA